MVSPNDSTIFPNSFLDRTARIFYNDFNNTINKSGSLLVFLPLIGLIIIFFVIKKYSKNRIFLWGYVAAAMIGYIIYFHYIAKMYYVT